MSGFDTQRQDDTGLATRERKRTARPRRYKVLLHNDDYSTMEFVVHVLMKHFKKPEHEAHYIMMQVHTHGVGVAGVYTREIAETKVAEVMADAEANEMPLLVTVEPA